jgi:hypothetical protein
MLFVAAALSLCQGFERTIVRAVLRDSRPLHAERSTWHGVFYITETPPEEAALLGMYCRSLNSYYLTLPSYVV